MSRSDALRAALQLEIVRSRDPVSPPSAKSRLNVDAGVGEYHLTERNGLCFSSECEEPHRRTDIAPYLGGSLGWLWHPGDVEIGPLLRFDVTGPVWAVTLNGALGFHFGTR